MQHALFFLLSDNAEQASTQQHQAVADIACSLYEKKRQCRILCNDQAQAEAIDELLWQLPTDRFVPHKIGFEGDDKPAPIELHWELNKRWTRLPLINLQQTFNHELLNCHLVYDFVPTEESAKQQARERYKYFRSSAFELATHPIDKLNEILDGQNL